MKLRQRERKMAYGVVGERKAEREKKTNNIGQIKTKKQQKKKKSLPTCWIQREINTHWKNNSLESACWAASGILLSLGNTMYKNEFKIQILLRMFTLQGMSCHKSRTHFRTDLTLSSGRHFQIFFFLFFKDIDFSPVSPNRICKQKAS